MLIISKRKFNLKQYTFKFQIELDVYLNLLLLLCADDTILLAESQKELQQELDLFYHYCTKWKLKVNIEEKPRS